VPDRQTFKVKKPFALDLGGVLPEIEITYETWGDQGLPGSETVMIIPALSADCHAASTAEDPTPGWWDPMIGPGRWIDTDYYRVVCASILGSPFGTTSPVTTDPRKNRPYGRDFPQITPADQARVHALVLDHLGLNEVRAAVGSSLGGMQVFQLAAQFPDRIGRIASFSSTGKTTPGTVALRRVGRLAILTDPEYRDGLYEPGHGPIRGTAVARELGMICYRSREEFNKRFNWNHDGPLTPQSLTFEVERYLAAQGNRFAGSFDANCYLLLSRCMDLMDLGAGQNSYAEGVLRIKCPTLIAGVDHDVLIPLSEQRHLAHLLESHNVPVWYQELNSIYGHDAFLKEYDWFGPLLRDFIADEHVESER
jgi:homoserine O-acetyltransferase